MKKARLTATLIASKEAKIPSVWWNRCCRDSVVTYTLIPAPFLEQLYKTLQDALKIVVNNTKPLIADVVQFLEPITSKKK